MLVLVKLLVAHFIGDFLLQPKSWVIQKEFHKVKSGKFYLHIFIHGLLVIVLMWDLKYWFLGLGTIVLHGLIDLLKLYKQKHKTKSKWFLIDQGLHVLSILILWGLFVSPELSLGEWLSNPIIWVYTAALLFITAVSGILMRELLSSWSNSLNDRNDESLSNAGKYIGILERLFVFTFVVSGNWEGIGFLLAAKSVFRFGDLKESKDRKLTEYILIGTLLSFGIAIVTGIAVNKLSTL